MADESNKVTIKVNAGTKDAESGLSRIWQGLNKVKSAVSGVMQTLARLNWAIMAVQTIVSWFQKVHEWMNRAATAAREFANELERERIAAAAEAAADAYRKLNKELEAKGYITISGRVNRQYFLERTCYGGSAEDSERK